MHETTHVKSLSEFVECIDELRNRWQQPLHKELWFRGEGRKYDTFLRPELYRPQKGKCRKPTGDLLTIEHKLYEDFQRCAIQLSSIRAEDESWDWDSYFLMQHHGAPTRLLDWTDGALIALHFAIRSTSPDDCESNPRVYVLEPYRLKEKIELLPDIDNVKSKWKAYVEKHPTYRLDDERWETSWLPADEADLNEVDIPSPSLLLEFPHITRRVAAQRSRFMVFGRDPDWIADRLNEHEAPIVEITIDAAACFQIRRQLRDSGVTEAVIFPDLDGLGRELKQIWEDRRIV